MAQPLQPDKDRMVARYQQELAQANDRAIRYAALADELADRVQLLEARLAEDIADDAPPATAKKVTKE